jgi:hypothetical protein
MREIRVLIKGVSPLMLHNIASANLDGKGPANLTLDQIIDKECYWTLDKQLGLPSTAIWNCLRRCADKIKVKIGGKDKKLSELFGASVHVGPTEILPLTIPKSKLAMEAYPRGKGLFLIDTRSAVNKNTKGRVLVNRPKILDWELPFTLELDEAWLPITTMETVIEKLLSEAGKFPGVGSYRPEHKGQFWTFRPVEVELLPAGKKVEQLPVKLVGF